MEYDRIIDKIIELKELVDRGLDGEASNAKRVLENLCKLHNVNNWSNGKYNESKR